MAGTKVTMADGTKKNIEEVQVGDVVLAMDENEKVARPARVLELESPTVPEYYEVRLANGTVIKVNDEHPFWARTVRGEDSEGWTSIVPEATLKRLKMKVGKLEVGSELLREDKTWVRVIKLSLVNKPAQTYNLKKVENFSTFFAEGVLVHNKDERCAYACGYDGCGCGGGGQECTQIHDCGPDWADCCPGTVCQYNGSDWFCDPPPPCSPSCSSPLCGQSDGCGGTCSSSDNSWSSCSAPGYQRTNACVGTETCKGTISGTVFNSIVGSCGNPTEGVAGASVSVTTPGGPAPAGCSLSGTAVTDANGNYSIGNLCSPATYLMTLDAPGDYIDEPESFCDGGLSVNLTAQGQTEDKDFGLTRIYDGWFQVQDGDVYAAGVISNYIPPSCQGACKARFVLDGSGGQPGVVGYGGWSANFGKGEVSSTGWLVNAKYQGKRYGFEFWRTHWNVSSKAESDWTNVELFTSASKPTSPPIHAKVYYANDDMIIADSTWQIANGEKIAVLVRGNLDIKAKISVAEGGFLAFAVSGDINIDPSINSEDGQGAVEGIYMADGEIDTGKAATKLILEGTFVGWSGVTLGRDFESVRNNTEPVEVFVYRPDIIAASPKYMKRPAYVWEEVAP